METKLIRAGEIRFYDDLDGANDEGRFTGKASVYGVIDSYDDVVVRGAFTNAIAKSKTRPLLNQHDPAQVIGLVELRDRPDALYVDARINLDLELGRDVYSNLKFGALDGLSIGFTTVKAFKGKHGGREIAEVDLWEVSVVTFPANTAARIGDLKSDADDVGALRALAASMNDTITTMRLGLACQRLDRLTAQFRATSSRTHTR